MPYRLTHTGSGSQQLSYHGVGISAGVPPSLAMVMAGKVSIPCHDIISFRTDRRKEIIYRADEGLGR